MVTFRLAIQEGVGLDIPHMCARQMGFFSILHYGQVSRDGYNVIGHFRKIYAPPHQKSLPLVQYWLPNLDAFFRL